MEPSFSQKSSPAIPLAIIIGFGMIALAIYFTAGRNVTSVTGVAPNATSSEDIISGQVRPVSAEDYIRGNPNAPILMIEYSDYDCPYCKQYHATLSQIMDEYGVTGKVAWVYRQFPIGQLHPNSPKISEAALCVGDIAGEDAFWKFTDLVFEKREIDEFTNMLSLPDYAKEAGASSKEYTACMDSGKMEAAVKKSTEDAFNIGARGTPYTILVVGTEQAVINGAQSYDTVKSIVENLIKQLEGEYDTGASTVETTE